MPIGTLRLPGRERGRGGPRNRARVTTFKARQIRAQFLATPSTSFCHSTPSTNSRPTPPRDRRRAALGRRLKGSKREGVRFPEYDYVNYNAE